MLLRISHETKLTLHRARSPRRSSRSGWPRRPTRTRPTWAIKLRTNPQAPVTSYRDGMGNRVDLFNVAKPYTELVMYATSYVRTHRRPGLARLEQAGRLGEGQAAIDSLELLGPSPLVDRSEALDQFVEGLPRPSETSSAVGFVQALMDAVGQRLKFESKVTKARTPVSEALALGRGVCQDFAHLCIAACRGLGVPARYVSGYVNHPGELATHAWCQLWAGDRAGWIDVDPTTREFVGDDHVAVAFGRDYSDVPPNKGLWKGRAEEAIAVTVKVEPIDRVPMEWNEWSQPNARPGLFQSQRMGGMSQRQGWAAYPNQRSPRSGLNQQQGEQ